MWDSGLCKGGANDNVHECSDNDDHIAPSAHNDNATTTTTTTAATHDSGAGELLSAHERWELLRAR